MVRGSGSSQPWQGDLAQYRCGLPPPIGRSGAVWTGGWPDRRDDDDPEWSWRPAIGATAGLRSCSRSPDPDPTDTSADWSGGPSRAPVSSPSALASPSWPSRRRSSRASCRAAGLEPARSRSALLVWALVAGGRCRPARRRHEPPGRHRRVRPPADAPAGRRSCARWARSPTTSSWRPASCRTTAGRSRSSSSDRSASPSSTSWSGRDRLRQVGHVVGDADPRRLGPDRASARSRRARRRARPALAHPRRSRFRGARLRCPGHARRDDPALTAVRGHQRAIRSRPGSRRSRASAASAPARRNHLLTRIRAGRTAADGASGAVGRGARTRTWNQRDISPPL